MSTKKTPIRAYDLEGNFLADYESAADCARLLKIDKENIFSVLYGHAAFASHFQFRYLTKRTPKTIHPLSVIKKTGTNIPIAKYFSGRLISVYNSISEAAEKNNLSTASVSQSVNGEWLSSCFRFKKITDLE